MITRIAVDDVQRVDLAEVMLQRVCRIDIGNTGVKAAAKQRRETSLFELVLIGPLPVILKLRYIARFVVCRVDVVNTRFKTGIHDREILIGKGDIDDDRWLEALEQLYQFRHVISIHTSGLNGTFQFGCDTVALRFRAACEHDLAEDVWQLRAFMGDDAANAASSDDEDFGHRAMIVRQIKQASSNTALRIWLSPSLPRQNNSSRNDKHSTNPMLQRQWLMQEQGRKHDDKDHAELVHGGYARDIADLQSTEIT